MTIDVATPKRPGLRGAAILVALRLYQSYRYLWFGTVATQLGQWMQQIALAWYMLQLTDSAFWVGLIGFSSGIPSLLVTLPAGAFIDRSDERKVLLFSQWASMAVAAGLAALILAGLAQPWHLLVVAALNGTIMAVNQLVRQTYVTSLVPREHLGNAVSLNSAGGNAMRIIGPSIAGVIIGSLGVAACFIVQALALGVALLMTLRIERVDSRGVSVAPGRVLDGLDVVRTHATIGSLVLLTAIPAVLVFPYIQLMSVFARDVWQIGAGGLGLLMVFSGLGAFLGALAAAMMDRMQRKGRAVMVVAVVYCGAVTAFAISPHPALAMAALFVSGFSGSIFFSMSNALILLLTEPQLRGRVMGVYMLTNGFTPFGALALGAFAETLGAPVAVGAACGLATLAIALSTLRMRDLRAT
jgi:MFS family permease